MNTKMHRVALANKLIKLSEDIVTQLTQANEFFVQAITSIQDILEDETLIKARADDFVNEAMAHLREVYAEDEEGLEQTDIVEKGLTFSGMDIKIEAEQEAYKATKKRLKNLLDVARQLKDLNMELIRSYKTVKTCS